MKTLLVSAIALLPLSGAMAQENLVINGGYERGSHGWRGNWSFINRATFALEGSAVGVVVERNWDPLRQATYQLLSTEPNQQYQLRFSLLSGAGRAGDQSPPGVSPVLMTWDGNVLGRFSNGSVSSWQSYEFTVYATTVETRFEFESLGPRVQLIDGISVVAIPEPSLLALVAVGTAALLTEAFRKRR